jgi:CBS domain-containing membrane protein
LNSVLILVAALVYNNATGRRYPHSQQAEAPHPHRTRDSVPTGRLGFRSEDLLAVLKERNQVMDISVDDLATLFRQTEMHAFRRRFGDTRCGEIMSRDIVSVEFATELAEAWRLMHAHRVRALPVLDRARRVIGIVTRSDFVRHADLQDHRSLAARLRSLLSRTAHSHSDKPEAVGQIMSAPVQTAFDGTPIVEIVPLLSDAGLHQLPIVNAERRLIGMVTQTDLVAALYETSLAQLGEAPPLAA